MHVSKREKGLGHQYAGVMALPKVTFYGCYFVKRSTCSDCYSYEIEPNDGDS